MVWLPDGEKTFKIYLAVLEQYRHVTVDRQTSCESVLVVHAMYMHHAIKTS